MQLLKEKLNQMCHQPRQALHNVSKTISPILSHNNSSVYTKDLRVFDANSHNVSHNCDNKMSIPHSDHRRSHANSSVNGSVAPKRHASDIPKPQLTKNRCSEQMLAYNGLDTIGQITASGEQTRNAITQRTQIVYDGFSGKIHTSNVTSNGMTSNVITPPIKGGTIFTKSSVVASQTEKTETNPQVSKRIKERENSLENELNILQTLQMGT